MAQVGAVILAAGESSRFGQPKQLAEFRGRTLIEHVVAAAKEAECHPIVVVIGSNSKGIAEVIGGQPIVTVENPHWRQGIGTSIRVGVQRVIDVAPEAKALVLLVCDQPLVTGSTIKSLIQRWCEIGKPIVASSYSNTLGVPALFDCSCFNELVRLKPETGAKPIILADPGRVADLLFPEGAIDIDTIRDYEALTANHGGPAQGAAASQPPS